MINKDDTEKHKVDKRFEKETTDIKFNQKWIRYEKEQSKFDDDWAKTYALIYGTY